MTYEGWANYATWAIKLWIDNDEGEVDYWQEQTKRAIKARPTYPGQTQARAAIAELAEVLRDMHEANAPTLTGVYADLLASALGSVDWHEIAEAMLDDYEESNADPEDAEPVAPIEA